MLNNTDILNKKAIITEVGKLWLALVVALSYLFFGVK